MDSSDKYIFELAVEHIATLNKLLPTNKFRFVPYNDSIKNVMPTYSSAPSLPTMPSRPLKPTTSFTGMGKLDMGGKRPAAQPIEDSVNGYSSPQITSNAPSVVEKEPSIGPHQTSLNLLENVKDIVRSDFASVYNDFDFEILERGIRNGYYINLEEFKVAAKQVIRAMSLKHKNLDMSYLKQFEKKPQAAPTHNVVKSGGEFRGNYELPKMQTESLNQNALNNYEARKNNSDNDQQIKSKKNSIDDVFGSNDDDDEMDEEDDDKESFKGSMDLDSVNNFQQIHDSEKNKIQKEIPQNRDIGKTSIEQSKIPETDPLSRNQYKTDSYQNNQSSSFTEQKSQAQPQNLSSMKKVQPSGQRSFEAQTQGNRQGESKDFGFAPFNTKGRIIDSPTSDHPPQNSKKLPFMPEDTKKSEVSPKVPQQLPKQAPPPTPDFGKLLLKKPDSDENPLPAEMPKISDFQAEKPKVDHVQKQTQPTVVQASHQAPQPISEDTRLKFQSENTEKEQQPTPKKVNFY